MPRRLGLGPVFALEWLTTSRRWQVYAARSGFVAILLAAMAMVAWSGATNQSYATIRAMAAVGQSFFSAIVGVQITLVLFAAPAATAGTICLDKARGNLLHLLATDLSDAEIVLGKLTARLVPVLGLVACALPVMALGTLLGGIDPLALLGAFQVSVGVAVLGCTLALALSVWGTKTHEVLLASYLAATVWVLFALMWWTFRSAVGALSMPSRWILDTNPYWVAFEPYWDPANSNAWTKLYRPLQFLAGCLGVSALLTLLAIAKVRSVTVAQAGRGDRRGLRWRLPIDVLAWDRRLRAPTLDRNPVLWREWHRARPSRWTRLIWLTFAAGAIAFSFIPIRGAIVGNRMAMEMGAVIVNGLQVSVGLLLLSVSAATALAEERVRGSLDVLLTTTLSTREIVWGKWRGTFRHVAPLAVLPALVCLACGLRSGWWVAVLLVLLLIMAYGAALTSLGLFVATWVPRLGRALALTVTAYLLMTVAWFFVVVLLINENELGLGLAMGSPFMGGSALGIFSTGGLHPNDQHWTVLIASILWTLAYAAVAAGLLIATLATFDRKLGRNGGFDPPRLPWLDVAPAKPEEVFLSEVP